MFLIAKGVEHFFKRLLATLVHPPSPPHVLVKILRPALVVQRRLVCNSLCGPGHHLGYWILFLSFPLSPSLEESEKVSRETLGMTHSFKSPEEWGAVSLGIGLPGMFWWMVQP